MNKPTLREDLCTFIKTTRCIILKMRNVLDKSCRENRNTLFMFNNLSDSHANNENMWKNMDSQTGHTSQYNRTQALYMLDN
jgi:hypothetical protein